MKSKTIRIVLSVSMVVATVVATAAPPAPTQLTPANSASVTVPFTISWSAVLDPGFLSGGYNWQVSSSPSFSPLVLMDSTNPQTTQDTISGLVNGTYFWRVQAADNVGQSAWSPARSFTVTGTGPGTPGTPVLNPTRGYSTFHPFEFIQFSWSNVPDAVTYRLEVSNDPNFPLGTVPAGTVTFWNENIRTNSDGYVHHPSLGEDIWFARVFATDSDFVGGIRSLPSNPIQFSVFFNNPIGPAPVLVFPVNNPTLTLPVTLTWQHVPNPQASGYAWEIARDAAFSSIEVSYNQSTEPSITLNSLTPGPKFWHVLSQNGLRQLDPPLNANTDWSTTGRFTISSAPPTPASISLVGAPGQAVYSGPGRPFGVQLTGVAPAGGATVALTSSNPGLVPVPPTLAVPAGFAQAGGETSIGQVTTPTPVTITATLNGVSTSGQFIVMPPTLNDDPLQSTIRGTGGETMFGNVELEGGAYAGVAPPGGYVVNLSASSPAATVPATVTIPAGFTGVSFSIQTRPVATTTPVIISASAGGVTIQWQITLEPSPVPTSFIVRQISTTGYQGVVTADGAGFDQLVQATSSNPAIASVPNFVTISAGSGVGYFDIATATVAVPTVVTIAVTGGGVTMSAPLTVNPLGAPSLASISVSPSSVAGGNPSSGIVTLSGPALAGGTAVSLSSQIPSVASVPASVTVAAGASSASFTVTTFPVGALTTVRITGAAGGTILDTPLNVTLPPPPPTPPAPTLVSPANQATVAQPINFDWNNAANAVTYNIQIDNSSSFSTPLTLNQTVSVSQATINGLPAQQLWWRVRGINSAGVPGPFSASRRFTAQTAPAAASLSAVSVSPTTVVGGNTSQGTVTLTGAAPTGGAVVTLSTSTPSVASTPASVTVAAGATSATFAIATVGVSTTNSVTISATFSGTTRAATLTVRPVPPPPPPASLSSLTLNPATVTGGSTSQGTVTLTSAAPSGGAVVALSSSDTTSATVPASVMITAGATSANFTVTSRTVTSTVSVTISASYNTITRTATLTVNPVPTGPLPAPSLVGPADDARFAPGANISFDWNDVTGAASYTIQIDDNNSFPSPFIVNQTVATSQFNISTLPTLRMWWRVRANDASGNPGTWSSARRFEVKN